ncbi:MAG TPA: hypothetical protein VFE07_10990 [Marmoricola sp.]|nr:hypothetical protein [Marmoricola sp.]
MSRRPRIIALALCTLAAPSLVALVTTASAEASAPPSVIAVAELGVGAGDANAINEYPLAASGNLPPIARIAGPHTLLGTSDFASVSPSGVAHDPQGDLFVSIVPNSFMTSGLILEFASDANGDVAPIRVIGGPNTRLGSPRHLAVDPSGVIYVVDAQSNAVLEFAAGATGDVAPATIISGPNTHLVDPFSIVLDPAGNVYVSNEGNLTTGPAPDFTTTVTDASIVEYAAGARGDASPIRRLAGPLTGFNEPGSGLGMLARDAFGDLDVTTLDRRTIEQFGPAANGDVAPIATIGGANTRLTGPIGIAVDSDREIVVDNQDVGSSMEVFSPGASGNDSPIRSIAGSNSELGLVMGVDVIDAAATRLIAAPTSKRRQVFSATLTRADASQAPAAGRVLVFSTKAPLAGRQDVVCRATTNAAGTASCVGVIPGADKLWDGSYTVTYSGDVDYLAAGATGRLTP